MECFILDTICNNLTKNKRLKLKSQLETMNSFFNNGYSNITQTLVLKRLKQIDEYKAQLSKIQLIPVIEQRSDEWYEIRKTLITASDFAQALGKGKFGTKKQFIKKKCGFEEDIIDMNLPPLQWGVRYEEVANMFYQYKMNVNVFEFGVIRHPTIECLGASPDGISELGIMLEIKCPWKRKKTETVPDQYYYQIQGQLDVCSLDECDYLECFIREYESLDDLIADETVFYKGIIISNNSKYSYGNINDLTFAQNLQYDRIYYYGIHDYYLKRIKKNPEFISNMNLELISVWNTVLHYRQNKSLYDKEICVHRKKIIKNMFRAIDNVGEHI
jgi:putative phage-type endonuclease